MSYKKPRLCKSGVFIFWAAEVFHGGFVVSLTCTFKSTGIFSLLRNVHNKLLLALQLIVRKVFCIITFYAFHRRIIIAKMQLRKLIL